MDEAQYRHYLPDHEADPVAICGEFVTFGTGDWEQVTCPECLKRKPVAATPINWTLTPQKEVAQAIAYRGYRHTWTAPQFAGRQVAKLAEELRELAACVQQQPDGLTQWERLVDDAGYAAQLAFDHPAFWSDTRVLHAIDMRAELADMQVVIFALADALEELTHQRFDVVQAAVDKARADVARGVR